MNGISGLEKSPKDLKEKIFFLKKKKEKKMEILPVRMSLNIGKNFSNDNGPLSSIDFSKVIFIKSVEKRNIILGS